MKCTACSDKVCIKEQSSCGAEDFLKAPVADMYHCSENAAITKAAASLVDYGRAGSMPRVVEIAEFARTMKYNAIGLAYCYGMEKHARAVQGIFEDYGLKVSAVSCAVGGLKQSEVNAESCIQKVSCNPLGQALQLNAEGVDMTVILGICLGHDMLLHRHLKMNFTTLVVKDRVYNNNPIEALNKLSSI